MLEAAPRGEAMPDGVTPSEAARSEAVVGPFKLFPSLLDVRTSTSLAGSVVDAVGQPIVGAWVSDGDELTRTDEQRRFSLRPGGGAWSVVAPGYRPVRAEASAVELSLEPFLLRAIYLPYEQLWRTEAMEWTLELARERTINAIVADIKEEGGATLPLAATADGLRLKAVVGMRTDVGGFLQALGELGVASRGR